MYHVCMEEGSVRQTIIPPAAASARAVRLGELVLPACLLLAAVRQPLLWSLPMWTGLDSPLAYQPVVPLLAGSAAWARRAGFRPSPDTGWAGAALTLAGCLLLVLAHAARSTLPAWPGLTLVLIGWTRVLGGPKSVRALRGPLLLMFCMTTLPGPLLAEMTSGMQRFGAVWASAVLSMLRIGHTLRGDTLTLSNHQLQVGQACSGLSILMPLLIIALFISIVMDCDARRRWILAGSAVVTAVLVNCLRIATMALAGVFMPKQADALHDPIGWISAFAAVALLWRTAHLLGVRKPWRAHAL
jgi:exosortase